MPYTEPPEPWEDDPPIFDRAPAALEVDWSPPDVIGALWLPGDSGFELVEYTETRTVGFQSASEGD